ncbi:MAG TPA: thiamine pyrophosphate-dependent enzyme [Ktedonobacteraceae bacterium]|jgi:phosphonopyruvate decarboxylase|nr:thiamine pyrophosphate-dependent enzyme [Ktedonobacteraceae bacterium]
MMKRDEILSSIAATARQHNAILFVGNAMNARAMYTLADRDDCFYMVGSMGLCPTIAAGFSHCAQVPVIAIEGDGNALMGLSGFPVASNAAKSPFVHIVLDNGMYESTGWQQNLSPRVDFVQLALGVGYDCAYHPDDLESFASLLQTALQSTRRTFMCVSTEPDVTHPRIAHHPRFIAQRFREAIASRLHS